MGNSAYQGGSVKQKVGRKPAMLAKVIALALCIGAGLPSQADGLKTSLGSIPKRILVVTVGATVGTPVALARCTKREVVKRTKECYSLGGVPKPLGYVTAGAFGIPSGIFFGAGVGAVDGVLDSVVNSGDEPLNKGSLSLDKLYF
jgi:hypothetical protein